MAAPAGSLKIMTDTSEQPTRLHALTFTPSQLPELCSGSYTCMCVPCQQERWERQQAGVRPPRGLPVKTRAALRDAA